MSTAVDLNSDMGESFGAYTLGHDAALLEQISSANIACGFHAGDPQVIARTVALAREHNVAIGAHPGFADLYGFGRRDLPISPAEARNDMIYQVAAMAGFCRAAGVPLQHVKIHGALYNLMARNESLALAGAEAVAAFDPTLIFVGLPGSAHEYAAAKAGLRFAREAFADRAYNPDGTLASRSLPGAVLTDPAIVGQRAVAMVTTGRVTAIDGTEITLAIDTLCLHGDTPGAARLAANVREALQAAGVAIRPLGALIG
jgi:UPF0271 protein